MTYFLQVIRTLVSHDKDFLWGKRGFRSIEEHDETIIANWNRIVKPEDSVFHLGDTFLNDMDYGIECLNRLNGTIYLVQGNHDGTTKIDHIRMLCPNVKFANTLGMEPLLATTFKYHKWNFYLCHFPMHIGDFINDDRKNYCLCGHIHTKDKWRDILMKSYHVELDCHHMFPVSIEEIVEDIKNYRNNYMYEG